MMREVLFELPIYSCSQQEFDEYWKNKADEIAREERKAGNPEDIVQKIVSLNSPRNIWKYNQIIGYIVIWVNECDVNFDLFHTIGIRRYYKNAVKKHFIQNTGLTGCHFYAADKTNQEIKEEILKYIGLIKKEHIKNKQFVEESVLCNLLPYIDIRKIMDDLKGEDNG